MIQFVKTDNENKNRGNSIVSSKRSDLINTYIINE